MYLASEYNFTALSVHTSLALLENEKNYSDMLIRDSRVSRELSFEDKGRSKIQTKNPMCERGQFVRGESRITY